jgi:hypothetical protein
MHQNGSFTASAIIRHSDSLIGKGRKIYKAILFFKSMALIWWPGSTPESG